MVRTVRVRACALPSRAQAVKAINRMALGGSGWRCAPGPVNLRILGVCVNLEVGVDRSCYRPGRNESKYTAGC